MVPKPIKHSLAMYRPFLGGSGMKKAAQRAAFN
jgi:hypothetical protein